MDQIRTNNEPMDQAVQEAIQEDKAAGLDIERKQTNVIIHSVPESDDDSENQNKTDDDATVAYLLQCFRTQELEAEKRDGNWSTIFVHQDLTPEQSEARKPLVAELKARTAPVRKGIQ